MVLYVHEFHLPASDRRGLVEKIDSIYMCGYRMSSELGRLVTAERPQKWAVTQVLEGPPLVNASSSGVDADLKDYTELGLTGASGSPTAA